jgi:uncharacterized protein (TIGR02145 family)
MNDALSKKANCAEDGSIQAMVTDNSGTIRGVVCDAGTFREATKADSVTVAIYDAVCVSYLEGRVNKTGYFSCLDGQLNALPKTFTDARDGKTYEYIQIGGQVWMAENLNYDTTGSYCYRDLPSNCAEYGRLYQWRSAKEVCPIGWHLPSKQEFEILIETLGGKSVAGYFLAHDNYGFSAVFAGANQYGGNSFNQGNQAYFWSSTEYSYNSSYIYRMSVSAYDAEADLDYTSNVYYGYSVRCIKD